jgi:type I restriction enzyme S subunit
VSWETVTLDKVCTIVNGGTPKSGVADYWDGDLNWITPKEMGKLSSREISSTERKITDKGLKNSSAKLLPVNSVILSSRAPIGH